VNIQELEPQVEVTHLRHLLDTQPSCLMRLGADGTVLAANDAALKLIGATSVAQVLGRDFSAWVPSDQRDRWTAFTTGVVQGYPASVECEIAAPSSDRQPTLFHGVPLTDHPDGVSSMAVAARAVSGQRQLEAAVIELEEQLRQRDAERFKARARLAESESRQRELAEKVEALEASLRLPGADAEHNEVVRRLEAEIEARDTALGAAEAARRAAETKAAQALADVQQLEVALDGFAARQKQMVAERAAERQRLEEMIAAAASRHEQELNAARDSQECERLAARLQDLEATVRGLEAALLEAQQALAEEQERGLADRAEHASLAATHASLTAEHDRLVCSLRQQVAHLDALANGFPAADTGADAQSAPGNFGSGGEEGLS
jgi:hypothetical protein